MKISKKIISVLLAVMLVIGSVAVAASAEMLTEKAGTVLTYTATVKGKTPNAAGAIEVEPGEKITVEVYTQANYYLGSVGSELFAWTTTFFNTPATEDYHIHNHINNYTPNKKFNITGAQLGSNYKTGYTGFLFGRAINTEYTTPTDASTPVLSYSFDFTVSDSVTEETTAKFVMPEQMLGLETVKPSAYRMIYCSVASNGTDYNAQGDASKFPESIDVSGAVINFVVKSAAVEVPCNYAGLDAAIAAAKAADKTNCTSASITALNNALAAAEAVERNMIVDEAGANQKAIDDATEALNAAITGLTKLGACDYAALDAAIAAAKAADTANCTSASIAALNDALAAAEAVARDMIADEAGANQATINAATEALNAAITGLTKLGACDYAALDAAIADYDALVKAEYTPNSWTASDVDAKYAAAKNVARDLVADEAGANQATITAAAEALDAAIKALVKVADKAALAAAIAAAPADKGIYTDETWATFEQALAEANRVNADANATQYAVDAATAALVDAQGKLETKKVDLTALEKAVADYADPEKTEEYYDAAEYSAWEAALENAEQGLVDYAGKDDTAENRDAVAALAADLKNAFEALIPQYIDYSALENAVAAYGTTPEAADAYKAETYEPYAAALARAKDMLANKVDAPASDANLAAQIQAAADELTATYKALELAPVEAIIKDVQCLQEHYKVGDTVSFTYLCSVTGVAKIQLIAQNGSTLTYHRKHTAVSIVDNGDGTETWTIATKIYFDEANMTAKAKVGKTWEAAGYKYSTATSDGEDFSVKSAEVLLNDVAVTEFSTTDTVVIKIVAGPNTLRMRLVDKSNGCTSTFGRTKATQDEDGNWVWLITRTSAEGDYAFDIYTTGSGNYLTDEGTDLVYTVNGPVEVTGPSTGDYADAVKSVTAKKRVLRGNEYTVTIVTDKNAKGVRVMDENYVCQGYTKDMAKATVNEDGDLVWTLTYKCTVADTFTCDVEALYGAEWVNNGTTFSYTVAY